MKAGALGAALLLAGLGWASAARGVSLTLTEAERAEARRVGEQNVADERLDAEWRVSNAAGERLLVLTPFYRLALATRHATLRGKPLTASDEARVLRETRDRLVLWVDLKGKSPDFARRYGARLLVGGREVGPAFVQNERTAAPLEGGVFLARCVYAFPAAEVNPSAPVTLSVRAADGREVARFVIDLSAMR